MFFRRRAVNEVSTPQTSDIDLLELLNSICSQLLIDRPPRIQWDDSGQKRFLGRYVPKVHTIFVTRGQEDAVVYEVVLHELAHAVLWRVGYRSAGHSWLFLALFDLLMRKCGNEKSLVEGCAVGNWNRFCPWPIWYRHVVKAQQVVNDVLADPPRLQAISAIELAQQLHAGVEQRPVLSVLARVWHEVIADTRGHWFALWHTSRVTFFLSFVLMTTKVTLLTHMGMWMLGGSVAGLFVVGKVFRLTENQSADSAGGSIRYLASHCRRLDPQCRQRLG